MIKSLEVVIAILLLFLFLLVMFQGYTKPETKLNAIDTKVYDIIKLKAKDTGFRDLISSESTSDIYNSLYEYIDVSYLIKLCTYLNSSCDTYGDTIPTNTSLSTVDYYFYDSNKTLSVISWVN